MEPVVHYMWTPLEVSRERLENLRDTGPNDIIVSADRAFAYIEGFQVPAPDAGPMRIIRTAGPSTAGRTTTD
ncbi:MAG: hypothetical protein ACOH2F_06290 [Cellulomonas sp.]